jgi:hypothetical protein
MVSEKNNLSIFSLGLNNTSIYKNNVLYIYKLQDSETKMIVLC